MDKFLVLKKNYYFLFLSVIFIGMLSINKHGAKLIDDLDPSWQYSLNYASSNNINYGEDIVFTYGPLGFISYLTEEGLSPFLKIVSWTIRVLFLVYFFVFLCELATNISKTESKDLSTLTRFVLVPFMFMVFGFYDYSIIIFICLIHSTIINILNSTETFFYSFTSRYPLILPAFSGFTISLLFFIKVSYFPFILVIPIVLIIKFLLSKEYKKLAGFIGTLTVTYLSVYLYFDIDVKPYVINSLEIISGYRTAMQIDYYGVYIFSYILSASLMLLYVAQFYYIRHFINRRNIIILFLILLSVYFMFTYSYTKGWEGGLIYSLPYVICIIYLVKYIIEEPKLRARIYNIIILVLIVSICNSKFLFYNLINRIAKPKVSLKIPGNIIKPTETYDVYPWNSSYTYFNKLKYKPRPVIQAYSSYTARLDSIDADFFSESKVDNIIFHGGPSNANYVNTIDGRYFMFDEPLTKTKILENYAVTDRINDSLFIASKRLKPIQSDLKLIQTYDLSLNQEFNIDSILSKNSLLFFTAKIDYLNSAKLLGLLFRMPYLKIDVTLKTGNVITFNVVSDLLKNPCILNKFCNDYNDFFKLANNPNALNDVKSIRIYSSKKRGSPGYKSDFAISVYKLEL